MARPESKPKTELAFRLREVRRSQGDPDRSLVAEQLGISVTALATYERGEREPSASVLAAYRTKYGIDLDWLVTGHGNMLVGGDTRVGDTTLAHIRRVAYNIAYSVAGKDLRRSKPADFAEEFVELFDLIISLDAEDEETAGKVVDFASRRLK